MVIYVFDDEIKIKDFIGNNLLGILLNVSLVLGFDGCFCGLIFFIGFLNSYIEFLNNGKLDIRCFMIILVWIYYNGRFGFIFNYDWCGFGVYLWMVGFRVFFVCFVRCFCGRILFVVIYFKKLCYCVWNYIGVIYDYNIGVVMLWFDFKFVVR